MGNDSDAFRKQEDGVVGWRPFVDHPFSQRRKPVRVDGKDPMGLAEFLALVGVCAAICATIYCTVAGSVVVTAELHMILESILGK